MARVAYVMEGIMSKLGLSGKAFIPLAVQFQLLWLLVLWKINEIVIKSCW